MNIIIRYSSHISLSVNIFQFSSVSVCDLSPTPLFTSLYFTDGKYIAKYERVSCNYTTIIWSGDFIYSDRSSNFFSSNNNDRLITYYYNRYTMDYDVNKIINSILIYRWTQWNKMGIHAQLAQTEWNRYQYVKFVISFLRSNGLTVIVYYIVIYILCFSYTVTVCRRRRRA